MEDQKKVWSIVGRAGTILHGFLWPWSLVPATLIWPFSLLPDPSAWASEKLHFWLSDYEVVTLYLTLWGVAYSAMLLGDPAKLCKGSIAPGQLAVLRNGPHLVLSRILLGIGTLCTVVFAIHPWVRLFEMPAYPVVFLGWIAVFILASQTQAILFWLAWQRRFVLVHVATMTFVVLCSAILPKLIGKSGYALTMTILCVAYIPAAMWIYQTYYRTPHGPPENPWKVLLPSLFDRKPAK